MRCLPKPELAWLLVLLIALVSPFARAEGIDVRHAALAASDEGYVLEVDFDIALNSAVEETLNKGVALNFVLEFELQRPRWYWFSEKVAQIAQPYKLSYNALTRQYRVSLGTLFQNFPSLVDAVGFMSRIRGVVAAERGVLRRGETYAAAVRLRLDVSQLPKPFQLNALGSREWSLGTDWHRWTVAP